MVRTKTFLLVNFGCRVNAAETNLLGQNLFNLGFKYSPTNPSLIIVNTCSVTAKGDRESRAKIKSLLGKYPRSQILATGCANLSEFFSYPRVKILSNPQKEQLLSSPKCAYNSSIPTSLNKHHRYLLNVQSGCSANCAYCIIPQTRLHLWSLPIKQAITLTKQALQDGFQEIIITGINLNQYRYGLRNLLEALLSRTCSPLISFGSLPLLCIDNKFISLAKNHQSRITKFLHVPIQSGSDRILRLMRRPYLRKDIIRRISDLKLKINKLSFGTDIIVGFPTETDVDFQQTYDLCQAIGFSKIHSFRFSPRPNTLAKELYLTSPKIPSSTILCRFKQIHSLIAQTISPSHQKSEKTS